MILFYCHRCGQKNEFKKKADMRCDCGHYVTKQERASDNVNMRTTWSGTTQVEFSETTVEESVKKMGSNN
tara:strand:- start:290 stop:499 length:210 start_codon:yes stop_codon:yes gene_type:complete